MYKRYLYYRDTANTENIGLMDEDGGGSISQRQTEREKDKEMERVKKKEREQVVGELHILFPPNVFVRY